jgi:aryl-alcohol dehydrogenase-like predicted oxidoreductase
MEKRVLGKTGLKVTVLGYGAMEIRGPRVWKGRPVTEDEAQRILTAVLDAGINFIDTAWCYGQAEELIGKSLGHRRQDFILATKCGCGFLDKGDHDETPHTWTRANLRKNIDDSLRRMQTDYIDIWQLHNPTPEQVDAEKLTEYMEEIKKEGKVRHVSISSTLPHITEYVKRGVFASYQIPYSALERKHEDVIALVGRSGAGVIVRGGVARGEPGAGLGPEDKWKVFEQAKLDELRAPGESRTAFLLRYTISHPHMTTTIVGTKNPAHIADNVKAVQAGVLAPKVYEEAKRRLTAAGQVPEAVA